VALVPTALYAALVVLLALAVDVAFGDPPGRVHPVAWIGRVVAAGRHWLCRGRPAALLLGGTALTLGAMALAAGGGAAVEWLAGALGVAGVLVEGVALKAALAVRGLATTAREVARTLERGELEAARATLGWHLVSRPTAALDAGQVASGAVESVAENLTDSLVAPVVFFLVLGLPGAFAYRALNTADAMLGYREGALEYFGKVAARLDDLVNLVPARLAALAIVVAAGARAPAAWSAMLRDHARTASPNAGWTMAAMAGALGVTLDKPSAYRLGDGRAPRPSDVRRSVRVMARAAALAVSVVVSIHAVIQRILAGT
jgi:adenosylcobinamide-phosphate synthase